MKDLLQSREILSTRRICGAPNRESSMEIDNITVRGSSYKLYIYIYMSKFKQFKVF